MPRIAVFHGIAVYMYYNDHDPAHFHVVYGGHRALVGMRPVRVLRGTLPTRAWALLREWALLHRLELEANWKRARAYAPLQQIAPAE